MGTIEEFWVKISQVDEEIEKRRKELEKRDRKWRYIAKLENGKCSVGLSEIDIAHPFYNLEDSNNMFIVKTERYNKLPLIIKGYGAGGKVTAAGVFGDILKVAKGCSR
jgi:bifunctional aspartokinase / homoserine dehydrogenase 1